MSSKLPSPPRKAPPSAAQRYPFGFKLAGIMAATCLIFALVGLDSMIIATAVPTMTRYFGTIADVGWYTSIYRLAAGSFQLSFGKFYSLFPAKPLLLASLVMFICGSLLCALAPASAVFILGRAVTGVATAGAISGAFAIIIQISPLSKRSTYAGIGAATEAAACLTAPLVGGVFTKRLGWRWCFYIELPLIALAILILAFLFEKPNDVLRPKLTATIRQLDMLGMALFALGFTTLILALQWGGNKYCWSDWHVLLPLGLFVALLLAFALLQNRLQERATLPPRLFLQRSIVCGFLFSSCNNGALCVVEYYMPIYFQTVKALSSERSGILVLPSAAGLIVSVPLAGVLTSRFGYYNPFMILNGVITPPVIGLLATLSAESKLWNLIVYQLLLGLGVGIGFQGPQVAVQAILSDVDSQLGIAIIQLAQGLGPAVFVAAAQTIFTTRLAAHVRELAPGVDWADLGRQGLKVPESESGESRAVVSSYERALNETFYLPVALACVSLVAALGMKWQTVRAKRLNG